MAKIMIRMSILSMFKLSKTENIVNIDCKLSLQESCLINTGLADCGRCLTLGLLLNLGPGVPERHNPVEDRLTGF